MIQYRLFHWNDQDDLIFLGETITGHTVRPGMTIPFVDLNDEDKNWLVSEVHFPNPRSFTKPNGSEYHPDPIVILTESP